MRNSLILAALMALSISAKAQDGSVVCERNFKKCIELNSEELTYAVDLIKSGHVRNLNDAAKYILEVRQNELSISREMANE